MTAEVEKKYLNFIRSSSFSLSQESTCVQNTSSVILNILNNRHTQTFNNGLNLWILRVNQLLKQ